MAFLISALGALFWESPFLEVTTACVQNEVLYRRQHVLSHELHEDAKAQNASLFEEQFAQAERHQDVNVGISVEQHAQNLRQAQLLYDKQRDYEERLAAREARRDIWDQKTEQTSTLLVLNTLMFSCVFGIMTQGMPPEDPAIMSPPWLFAFALSLSTSFVSLFVSILYALSLQLAMSQYRIDNPLKVYSCRQNHLIFYDFWQCHCVHFSKAAYIAFFFGTCSLAATACILMYIHFAFRYQSLLCAGVFVGLCFLTMPFVIGFQGRNFARLIHGALEEHRDTVDVAPVMNNPIAGFSSFRRRVNLNLNPDVGEPVGGSLADLPSLPGHRMSETHLSVPTTPLGGTNRATSSVRPNAPLPPALVPALRRTTNPPTAGASATAAAAQDSIVLGIREGEGVGNGDYPAGDWVVQPLTPMEDMEDYDSPRSPARNPSGGNRISDPSSSISTPRGLGSEANSLLFRTPNGSAQSLYNAASRPSVALGLEVEPLLWPHGPDPLVPWLDRPPSDQEARAAAATATGRPVRSPPRTPVLPSHTRWRSPQRDPGRPPPNGPRQPRPPGGGTGTVPPAPPLPRPVPIIQVRRANSPFAPAAAVAGHPTETNGRAYEEPNDDDSNDSQIESPDRGIRASLLRRNSSYSRRPP